MNNFQKLSVTELQNVAVVVKVALILALGGEEFKEVQVNL